MFVLTYEGQEEPEDFPCASLAVRAMAQAIDASPLTERERRAWAREATADYFEAVKRIVERGQRYQLRLSVDGVFRLFAIDPPPTGPLVTREVSG